MQSWEEQKGSPTESFHLDPEKLIDPVEDLLARLGPDGAIADLETKLDKNPDDAEARRELNLIHNRLVDIVAQISNRVSH